jgi:hypothetical protein
MPALPRAFAVRGRVHFLSPDRLKVTLDSGQQLDLEVAEMPTRKTSIAEHMQDLGPPPKRTCPKCASEIPAQSTHCHNCGHQFAKQRYDSRTEDHGAAGEEEPGEAVKDYSGTLAWADNLLSGVMAETKALVAKMQREHAAAKPMSYYEESLRKSLESLAATEAELGIVNGRRVAPKLANAHEPMPLPHGLRVL